MSESTEGASPKSAAESLNELKTRNYLPLNILHSDGEFWVSKADYDFAIAIIRKHQAEQPNKIVKGLRDAIDVDGRLTRYLVTDGRGEEHQQDVVERVADSICDVADDCNASKTSVVGNPMKFAKAAIAAMGDGSAAIAPVSAETVQPIIPAPCSNCGCLQPNTNLQQRETSVAKCDHEKTFHHRYLTNAQLDDMHERMNHEVSREEICKIADLLETRHLLITQRHPSPQVNIEAGAIACSQWVYGSNHGKPSWDRLSEEHRNEYREQAKACARAWGLTWE